MRPIAVTRTGHRLLPDPNRVVARHYLPAEELVESEEPRVARLVRRVVALPEEMISELLDDVIARFSRRHRDFEAVLEANFARVAHHVRSPEPPSRDARMLIGAYVTHEYTIEAAALFNPSTVLAPDQSGLAAGEARFVMSLRAVGEGHVSSIEFRSGVVDDRGSVTIDPPSRYASLGTRRPPRYDKALFAAKLAELGADNAITEKILGPLGGSFTADALDRSVAALDDQVSPVLAYKTVEFIRWLAASNYVVDFPDHTPLSERVLFPEGPAETGGMEDARLCRFVADDGTVTYYGTYTAFDGSTILPQLLVTTDFDEFRVATLNGRCAQNKGMALFPRPVNGRFAALSRYDQENIDIMFSDNVRHWQTREPLRAPRWPWELTQIGNCGSPIETEAGWLVLTHGVGAMRQYVIGAVLLDRSDPRRVIADLPEPLLVPDEQERNGYVPNVLYSCGGLVHAGRLLLPYAFSDAGVHVCLAEVDELVRALLDHPVDTGAAV